MNEQINFDKLPDKELNMEAVPSEFIDSIRWSMRRYQFTLSERVLQAFKLIPRSFFVQPYLHKVAYIDKPLEIPMHQTISAPHMYAFMYSEQLGDPYPNLDILEVGTGSGYGAALLAYISMPGKVVSIERHAELVQFAHANLKRLPMALDNLTIIHGDGTLPPEELQFDRIIVTAAGPKIPESLLNKLKVGGKLIMPVEQAHEQVLWKVTKQDNGEFIKEESMNVIFVKLIGKHAF